MSAMPPLAEPDRDPDRGPDCGPDCGPATAALPRLPPWGGGGASGTAEAAALRAGAALAALHQMLGATAVPQALLRDRLALGAAEHGLALAGRPERAAALRDALAMLRPGDLPGPGGAVYLAWRRAVARPITPETLRRALPEQDPAQIGPWLRAASGQGDPVAAAAMTLETVLAARPGAEAAALILADAALARALKWRHVLPLLGTGLGRRDLGRGGAELRLACYRALPGAAEQALALAGTLARGAARLRAVQPKLRAKGADAAVEMLLGRDAAMATALPLPDRAARRLCDRLVALGALRELSGRSSYRLYGI